MQRHARVDQPDRRARAAAFGHPQPSEQPRHRRVERRLVPERIVDLGHARQDLGQLGVQLAGDEGRIGVEIAHGALDAARRPVQVSSAGSRGRTNSTKRIVACPGRITHHRSGFLEPRQVQDVAVLPELEMRVAVAQVLGRRRQQQRAIRSDPPHQLRAPFCVRRRRDAGGGDGRDGRDGHRCNSNLYTVPAMSDLETAVVSPRGAARIAGGHPWVFRPDVVRGPKQDASGGGPSLVRVRDGRGRPLGVATWAALPRLALRMVARAGQPEPTDLAALVAERLAAALARRQALNLDRDAYRVAHAESDFLPGLVVDRYADAAVIQTTSVAMSAARARLRRRARAAGGAHRRLPRRRVGARLRGAAAVRGRRRGRRRHARGLPAGAEPTGGRPLARRQDRRLPRPGRQPRRGGGAGAAGRARAGRLHHHGGFALALARRAGEVLAIDENPAAAERARRQRAPQRAGPHARRVRQRLRPAARLQGTRRALRRRRAGSPGAGEARRRTARATTAARAYKERAARRPADTRRRAAGGLLVFGARDARALGRDLRRRGCRRGPVRHVLDRAGAGRDHPELVGVPETSHLKVWTFRVL